MADPLSVVGSAVGIVSLGIQVVHSIYDYYTGLKDQHSSVGHTLRKTDHLLGILNNLQSRLKCRSFRADETDLVVNVQSAVDQCNECIQELQNEVDKFKMTPVEGLCAAAHQLGRRLAYPIRQSTLLKLNEDIYELVVHLSLALQLLEHSTIDRITDSVDDVRTVLDLVRSSQVSFEIREWLKAPDASTNFNEACKMKHAGTGMWFIKSSSFANWLHQSSSFLWLQGFAGCGKTVLCSTAIQHTLRHRRSAKDIGIAFFFFTFNDESKQDASAMLRALLFQLTSQLNDTPRALKELRDKYCPGTPPEQALLDCLYKAVREFREVYILVDALDESPRNKYRQSVLECIQDIRAWSQPGVHLLATSRDEPDIRRRLEQAGCETLSLRNTGVDKDIASFVSSHLRADPDLSEWQEFFDRIEETLIQKAQGVFRWVECQLKALLTCPNSEYFLDQLLESLPETLDETYTRMLQNIPSMYKHDARQMLAILSCAMRPLTVPELIDALATETSENPRFNSKRRLKSLDSIQKLCPGFTEIDTHPGNGVQTVRLAHFSVLEYLESERDAQNGQVAFFKLCRQDANNLMAYVCLTVLLEPGLAECEQQIESIRSQYPLVEYAAEYWPCHLQEGKGSDLVEKQVMRLFLETNGAFDTWAGIHGPFGHFDSKWYHWSSPAYVASLLGYHSVITAMLNEQCGDNFGIDEELLHECDDEHQTGNTALYAAARNGHKDVIQVLINMEANAECLVPGQDTPLNLASDIDPKSIVELMLLYREPMFDTQHKHSPLSAAAENGHTGIVEILLDYMPAVQVHRDYALLRSSTRGHQDIAKLLLDVGVNVNFEDNGDTPLTLSSKNGHKAVIELLLESGANVNGGSFQQPLAAASREGHEDVVELLLDRGADVNGRVDAWTPLAEASRGGWKHIAELLLDRGANVNGHSTILVMTPLVVASRAGKKDIVRLLLERGATAEWDGLTEFYPFVEKDDREAVQTLLRNAYWAE
ncbi:hypothetical protein PFICI_04024 [Pestalotiopsis fici W106-1]|uniref:NACHT domain-containing protein n=1 Tax=Pestalotiopsis fici (strain W106-1 / CGMCC3.15140) TaxID=1229662 RepID=W3XJ06_PESFW|nr:uncharacterized protein PFICI_04024 [Pestalotiopsis fici W106-1]ETS85999.1 hypothetical protein PFICI_04024 [Pestalotiopsis fici W106-1]